MNDLFTALQQHDKAQETNRPTKGVVKSVDGDRVNVLVRGSSTILHHVKAIGAITVAGQEVVLTWENGTPTAHVVGGMAEPSNLVALSKGPTGPEGPAGPEGPEGPQGPEGPAGSVDVASSMGMTEQSATPAPPSPGTLLIYAKDDGEVYKLDSDGNEEEIGTGVGGGGTEVTPHQHKYVDLMGGVGMDQTIPAGATRTIRPWTTGLNDGGWNTAIPASGILSGMYFRTASTQSGGSLVCTLYVDNVAQPLVVTVPAGSPAGIYSNTTDEVSISAGQTFWFSIKNNSGGASAGITSAVIGLEEDTSIEDSYSVNGLGERIDQSGGTSDTYGELVGNIDGANTSFTVSAGVYVSGTLRIYLNGQLQTQGTSEDWVETDSDVGNFDFAVAPVVGDQITVTYKVPGAGSGDADTLDGYHADAFVQAGALIDIIYPVGSIYTSVLPANPGTLFGKGTWVSFGAGRVLVGIDPNQGEFDTAEEVGGEKTHTLTQGEMPSHTHAQNAHNHTQNPHNHYLWAGRQYVTGLTSSSGSGSAPSSAGSVFDLYTGDQTATNNAATATNQNAGGNGAHNNLQPYVVVYMWKRTA